MTHITYITHIVKLISEAYKQTNTLFYEFLFLYIKMTNKY